MYDECTYFVYILASRTYGTLYIGVTNDLYRRLVEHREGGGAFTKNYKVDKLMWFEPHSDIEQAIQREKSLKRWPRAWKINLIEQTNPKWQDLFPAFQKYEPRPPGLGIKCEMGPGHAPSAIASGVAQDDSGGDSSSGDAVK